MGTYIKYNLGKNVSYNDAIWWEDLGIYFMGVGFCMNDVMVEIYMGDVIFNLLNTLSN